MSSLTLHVDAGQIQQVLTNLIVNAVESMPPGGPVEVKIVAVTRATAGRFRVRAGELSPDRRVRPR